MNRTYKQYRDRLIESWLTALGEWLVGGGIEQKRKRPYGCGQQGGDCGAWRVGGGGRGLKGDKW